jgi:hypothetical protein
MRTKCNPDPGNDEKDRRRDGHAAGDDRRK